MKKCRKARKLAFLLVSILVLDFSPVSSYINTYAYTERSATVNASSLNVRSGPGTTYSIVTKLTSGASITVIDEKYASDGALWYQIRFSNSNGQPVTGFASKSYLSFPVIYKQDANFEAQLSSEGFPESYKIRLRQLHALHPQWIFRAQKTNLDWNTAVKEQSKVGKNLVHTSSMSSWKSTLSGAYNWDTSTWVGFDGSSWVTASEDIVRYYMDPRNFLDETNVFQFLNHSYDSSKQTISGLNTMVKGTFLSGSASGGGSLENASNPSAAPSGSKENTGPGASQSSGGGGVSLEGPGASTTSDSASSESYGPGYETTESSSQSSSGAVTEGIPYPNMIMNAASQAGVNPYVLAAMIIQEQGASGTGNSISGKVSGYEGFYNFFNIEAYQSGSMSAVQRGLWWASQSGSYGRPWNSQEKSIVGGSLYYGNNYVKVGQDTFYLKKFNVQGSNLYKHQYMTNVQGAASEGIVFSKAYSEEMKTNALEFKIPIYDNMPDNPSNQPTGDGNPNNMLASLKVEGFTMTPSFHRDTGEYNLIVDPSVSVIQVSASAISSTAAVNGIGTVQLESGNNDIKISVTAQNGTVRDYVIHAVRQGSGVSSNSGSSSGPGVTSSPGSSSGPGVTSSPGSSQSNPSNPGGSNVTIVSADKGNDPVETSSGEHMQGPDETKESVQSPAETTKETQAQETSMEMPVSYSTGDIDGDGKIGSKDVLKLQRHLLGLEALPESEQKAADLNGDNEIDSRDILILKKKVLGL